MWSASLLGVQVGDLSTFRCVNEERYIGYTVGDAPHSMTESPLRVLNEIADRLHAQQSTTVSDPWRLLGLIAFASHHTVLVSKTLGRECHLPGMLYDPTYVATSKIKAHQRLFPQS